MGDDAPRRVIAITGAGGTLGSAICGRLASEPHTALVMSDVAEPALMDAWSAPRTGTAGRLHFGRRRVRSSMTWPRWLTWP